MTSDKEQQIRLSLANSNHIIIKIGSSSIADMHHGLYPQRIDHIVDAILPRIKRNTSVVIVSSGAIASGIPILGLKNRPSELSYKQAAASVGQMTLTQAWANSFARYNLTVGQILLTVHDVSYRAHYVNAVRTFERLRSLGVIAIVNENDTLATGEIRFGDNDHLAAIIAHLTGATGLFLFSDIDAIYDNDPRLASAKPISLIDTTTESTTIQFGKGNNVGTGGMESKLHAGLLAATSGIPVLVTSANNAAVALDSANIGTVFAPAAKKLSARKFWVKSIAIPQGALTIDNGAKKAITHHRKSLLSSGIIGITGDFDAGDVIQICDTAGNILAHGITNYDSFEIDPEKENPVDTIYHPIVHANDLVLIEKPLHRKLKKEQEEL